MPYSIALNFEKGITLFFFTIVLFLSCKQEDKPYTTWAVYRGDKESTGYSALNQINKTNLTKLELAWTYHTGDAREGNRSNTECNPIIVNRMMYVSAPQVKLIAPDPATGKEIWKSDPFKKQKASGVAYTADEKLRIFDKQTGKLLWQCKISRRRLCHAICLYAGG